MLRKPYNIIVLFVIIVGVIFLVLQVSAHPLNSHAYDLKGSAGLDNDKTPCPDNNKHCDPPPDDPPPDDPPPDDPPAADDLPVNQPVVENKSLSGRQKTQTALAKFAGVVVPSSTNTSAPNMPTGTSTPIATETVTITSTPPFVEVTVLVSVTPTNFVTPTPTITPYLVIIVITLIAIFVVSGLLKK